MLQNIRICNVNFQTVPLPNFAWDPRPHKAIFCFSTQIVSAKSSYHKNVKSLRILLLAAVAAALAGCLGCNDQPRLRMVGSPAPDFTIQDSDRTVALHDLRGKVVVLNFWSAHCAPCIAEMPSLVQLQKLMGNKITVVGVAVDTTNDEYHAFLKKHGIDFLTVLDSTKNSYNLYGATGYPETTIIDRNGRIRRKFVFAMNWTGQDIVEYLNKL